MRADARIVQLQVIRDEEDEKPADDDGFNEEQGEPDSQRDAEDDEDQDDELGSSGEWGTSI